MVAGSYILLSQAYLASAFTAQLATIAILAGMFFNFSPLFLSDINFSL
jgi:hypothetical protein